MEKAAADVVRALRDAGHDAHFAGGHVRDRLLGLKTGDIDIATSALPEEIERTFRRSVPVGRAFGVVRVMLGPHAFEVATYRTDGPYLDGRRPSSVTFTDLKSDVLRRDFTVNGMMYDPVKKEVIDLVGGREDIEKRIIRTIGRPEDRFEEDRLRLLRAVRFATVLGFEIDPATWDAVVRMAPAVVQVSAERIQRELRRILLAPRRARGAELLRGSGLLEAILPEAAAMEGVPQPSNFHPEGDVWTHTVKCLEYLEDPSFVLAFATLVHDAGKPVTITHEDRIRFNRHEKVGGEMARKIGRRLRLSNEEIDRVAWLVERHLAFMHLDKMRASKLKRLLAHDYFDDLVALHRADALGSNGDLSALDFIERFRSEIPEPRPAPLLTGRDLIAAGFRPGPAFGPVLREAYDAQLEDRLHTKEEALEFARRHPALKIC
jgi:poly(A) polymerase